MTVSPHTEDYIVTDRAGIRASEQTGRIVKGNSEGQALGLAVKIEDGSIEILYVVVMEILMQLGIGDSEKWGKLGHFHYLERKNTMDVVTGQVTPVFDVHPVDEML